MPGAPGDDVLPRARRSSGESRRRRRATAREVDSENGHKRQTRVFVRELLHPATIAAQTNTYLDGAPRTCDLIEQPIAIAIVPGSDLFAR